MSNKSLFIGSVSGPFHTPKGSGANSEISRFRLVLGPRWISPISRTGRHHLPFARCTGVQYPVPGTRCSHRTGQNRPKRPRKVLGTLPKGLEPLLKEVISDRCGAHAGLPHGPGGTGPTWARMAESASKQAQKWPKKVRLTIPKGQGPLLKFSIFDRFRAHLAWSSVGG